MKEQESFIKKVPKDLREVVLPKGFEFFFRLLLTYSTLFILSFIFSLLGVKEENVLSLFPFLELIFLIWSSIPALDILLYGLFRFIREDSSHERFFNVVFCYFSTILSMMMLMEFFSFYINHTLFLSISFGLFFLLYWIALCFLFAFYCIEMGMYIEERMIVRKSYKSNDLRKEKWSQQMK